MAYLLKEVLKYMCALNQWSYAVFWKIGCQNPKLLIWEDCYYETVPESMHLGMSRINNGQLEVQHENKVSMLMDRMMMRNQIIIVGEGMVGRAAFTRKHQWFLPENYLMDVYPPEVLNEAHRQYSAGMQTVAVIPVLPHGVVQLGSCFSITENVRFVEDVKSLICQLGCIPDALLSESCTADEPAQCIEIPTSPGGLVSDGHSGHINMKNSTSISNSSNQHSSLSNASRLVGESSDSVKRQVRVFPPATASTFQTYNLPQPLARHSDNHRQSEMFPVTKPNDFERAIAIPPNIQAWMKLNTPPYGSTSGFNNQNNIGQSVASCCNLRLKDKQTLSDSNSQDHVSSNSCSSDGFVQPHRRIPGGLNSSAHKTPLFGRTQSSNNMASRHKQNSVQRSFSNLSRQSDISLTSIHIDGPGLQNADSFTTDNVPHSLKVSQNLIKEAPRKESPEIDLFEALHSQLSLPDEHFPDYLHGFGEHKTENESLRSKKVLFEDFQLLQPSGDDLFDILGVDFKNKLINSNQNSFLDVPYIENGSMGKFVSTISQQGQGISSVTGGISEGMGVSGLGSEHCLDAVIPKGHLTSSQSLTDTVSCMETLTKSSGGAAQSTSSTFNGACMSSQISAEVFCHPRTSGKAGMEGSSSFRSGFLEEDARNCSQSSSIYGSQISSLAEQCNNGKRGSSVSTAYSKSPDEVSKSKRKRLKPGENPRPRPKDRQMIQDRVKELREMVPHGAKCSIDALLERTIKHMVFLQSVTKHADKLKQTGESQISSKEGGLLLKDNFEGGATWAFEVGSKSMVCPIIVEDLNLPRQMLVEMLCEDRGFFLEIADFIRGLGLTILTGVIEARNEKIWARFAVEANRDVTRMEIFISLVALLEQTAKSSGGSGNGIFSENMTVHHSVHQAPPVHRPPIGPVVCNEPSCSRF